jgi:hypothetical protein
MRAQVRKGRDATITSALQLVCVETNMCENTRGGWLAMTRAGTWAGSIDCAGMKPAALDSDNTRLHIWGLEVF